MKNSIVYQLLTQCDSDKVGEVFNIICNLFSEEEVYEAKMLILTGQIY